ncbi:Cof-type HAD-IIB family hydrolase [Marinicrinis lubricantis]|uniref:Cof-type HAD-IIB family hydrolase n=1 Tax=Marinicrinis lubricantis TaxID=2086470 RepID=A0ABW1IU72_9BACL
MYKLVTIDIDDTLITDDKVVTDGTKEALVRASEKDVILTLATGRMFASAKQLAKQLGLNVPIITYQGALIKTLIDEKPLYERFVPEQAVRNIFDYAQAHQLHLQAYVNDQLFAAEENQKLIDYCSISNVPYTIEPDLEKLIAKPMPKLIMIDEPELLDRIIPEIKALLGDAVHVTKSKPNFLEFVHPEGTKGHAVQFLAEHFGCTLDEVIAIGDSWNDREMIEMAGLGVAMGNAIPALKELADYVTLTNNEEGVKHVIEKFILHPAQQG